MQGRLRSVGFCQLGHGSDRVDYTLYISSSVARDCKRYRFSDENNEIMLEEERMIVEMENLVHKARLSVPFRDQVGRIESSLIASRNFMDIQQENIERLQAKYPFTIEQYEIFQQLVHVFVIKTIKKVLMGEK
jgi:hypothetical protein